PHRDRVRPARLAAALRRANDDDVLPWVWPTLLTQPLDSFDGRCAAPLERLMSRQIVRTREREHLRQRIYHEQNVRRLVLKISAVCDELRPPGHHALAGWALRTAGRLSQVGLPIDRTPRTRQATEPVPAPDQPAPEPVELGERLRADPGALREARVRFLVARQRTDLLDHLLSPELSRYAGAAELAGWLLDLTYESQAWTPRRQRQFTERIGELIPGALADRDVPIRDRCRLLRRYAALPGVTPRQLAPWLARVPAGERHSDGLRAPRHSWPRSESEDVLLAQAALYGLLRAPDADTAVEYGLRHLVDHPRWLDPNASARTARRASPERVDQETAWLLLDEVVTALIDGTADPELERTLARLRPPHLAERHRERYARLMWRLAVGSPRRRASVEHWLEDAPELAAELASAVADPSRRVEWLQTRGPEALPMALGERLPALLSELADGDPEGLAGVRLRAVVTAVTSPGHNYHAWGYGPVLRRAADALDSKPRWRTQAALLRLAAIHFPTVPTDQLVRELVDLAGRVRDDATTAEALTRWLSSLAHDHSLVVHQDGWRRLATELAASRDPVARRFAAAVRPLA
ncbi:MAG: hypothetical protein ACRDTM_10865, partial [Micromonosporaceae bacterium]